MGIGKPDNMRTQAEETNRYPVRTAVYLGLDDTLVGPSTAGDLKSREELRTFLRRSVIERRKNIMSRLRKMGVRDDVFFKLLEEHRFTDSEYNQLIFAMELFPDVRKFIDSQRVLDRNVIMATLSTRSRVELLFRRHDIRGLFDGVYAREDLDFELTDNKKHDYEANPYSEWFVKYGYPEKNLLRIREELLDKETRVVMVGNGIDAFSGVSDPSIPIIIVEPGGDWLTRTRVQLLLDTLLETEPRAKLLELFSAAETVCMVNGDGLEIDAYSAFTEDEITALEIYKNSEVRLCAISGETFLVALAANYGGVIIEKPWGGLSDAPPDVSQYTAVSPSDLSEHVEFSNRDEGLYDISRYYQSVSGGSVQKYSSPIRLDDKKNIESLLRENDIVFVSSLYQVGKSSLCIDIAGANNLVDLAGEVLWDPFDSNEALQMILCNLYINNEIELPIYINVYDEERNYFECFEKYIEGLDEETVIILDEIDDYRIDLAFWLKIEKLATKKGVKFLCLGHFLEQRKPLDRWPIYDLRPNLNRQDVETLLNQPLETSGLSFSSTQVDLIIRMTGGLVRYVNLIAYFLWHSKRNKLAFNTVISDEEIEEAYQQLYRNCFTYYGKLIDDVNILKIIRSYPKTLFVLILIVDKNFSEQYLDEYADEIEILLKYKIVKRTEEGNLELISRLKQDLMPYILDRIHFYSYMKFDQQREYLTTVEYHSEWICDMPLRFKASERFWAEDEDHYFYESEEE